MIQAVDRAAKILASLQGARHLGITELAAILELPPSTIHGIVKTLAAHGLVAKEPNGNRYMLGPALLKLSSVYLDSQDVRARAMRWTAELTRRTQLASRLAVPLFDEVIVIHHELRPGGSEQMLETGMSIPAHASALGKVLLGFNPELLDELLPDREANDAIFRLTLSVLRNLKGSAIWMPVTYFDSSEAKNSAALATSQASPMCPIGTWASRARHIASTSPAE